MHFWRVEVAASLFLLITLSYLFYQQRGKDFSLGLSRQELQLIVLPLIVFIVWSGLSMMWSPSWKSALYHTLIWTEYLIFYIVVRHILNEQNGYKSLISLVVLVFLIIGLPAIIEYCYFIILSGSTSLGIRYAKYGEQISALLPLIVVGILRLKGKQFVLGLLVVTAMWLFIISTLGRTNLVLFVCGMAGVGGLVFALKRFHKYRRKMLMIVLATVFIPLPVHLIALFSEKPNVPMIARLSDDAGITYSGNFRKLMTSISIEIFTAHPVIGVGADNYGMQFNDYRKIYAAKNPTDINLKVAENELAERSHNEYLQILAELGIIGGLIFLWFLSSIGVMTLNALKRLRRISLIPLAALLGVALFLASSFVSSFSFRLMQNGLVFFFVLAVAAKFLLASKFSNKKAAKVIVSAKSLKLSYSMGIAACLLLMGYCLVRVASANYTVQANQQPDIEQAIPFYETALRLDNENPNARYYYGLRLLLDKQYVEAIPQFEQSIKDGLASSADFSYLATAQTLSGDAPEAEATFAEAVRLYPLSPFVRTRYAALLQANGKTEECRQQLEIASKIDQKQTDTWWNLINRGQVETLRMSFQDKNLVNIIDLTPHQSVSAMITERELRFPQEKVKFNFDK